MKNSTQAHSSSRPKRRIDNNCKTPASFFDVGGCSPALINNIVRHFWLNCVWKFYQLFDIPYWISFGIIFLSGVDWIVSFIYDYEFICLCNLLAASFSVFELFDGLWRLNPESSFINHFFKWYPPHSYVFFYIFNQSSSQISRCWSNWVRNFLNFGSLGGFS